MIILLLLLLLLFGTIYCIYLLHRNEEVYKTKCELNKYISNVAKKEIDRSFEIAKINNWQIYYDFLFDHSVSYDKLLFDFRINLNEFKENFIKEIDKLYERNK